MEHVETRSQSKPRPFPSIIGFLILGLALLAWMMKQQPLPPSFPCLAFLGGVAAWKWRWMGAHGAAVAILLFNSFFFLQLFSSEIIWILGWVALLWMSYLLVVLGVEQQEQWLQVQSMEMEKSREKEQELARAYKFKEHQCEVAQERLIETERQLQLFQHTVEQERQVTQEQQHHDAERLHQTGEALRAFEKTSQQQMAELYEWQKRSEILEQRLHQCEKQLNEKKQLSEASPSQEEVPVKKGSSFVHYEAMYKQLKQQFEAKHAVLEATRRELFYTQEKWMALAKQTEENDLYGENSQMVWAAKALAQADAELSQAHQEIDALSSLITHLLSVNDKTLS